MITYLYHKQHKQTGLNYFGKTTKDPQHYRGSGKYWLSHLKKHGNDIETLQVWKFTDIDECSKFALEFSFKHNIVESNNWANLRFENGLVQKTLCLEKNKAISIKKLQKRFSHKQQNVSTVE